MPLVPDFHGQTVWITGASAGIGAALAREFAEQGARLVLSARRREVLESVAADCKQEDGPEHIVLPLDLSRSETFADAVAQVDAMGGAHVLVHNAGVGQRAPALATTAEEERQIMEINFFGPANLTRAVLPGMIERGGGQLVVISSIAGRVAPAYRTAYAASKHAVMGWFEALRAEHTDDEIHITIVMPSYVSTNFGRNASATTENEGRNLDTDDNRLSPQWVAQRVVVATAWKQMEVIVAGKERLALLLRPFMPRVMHRVLARRARKLRLSRAKALTGPTIDPEEISSEP
jgi:short-subunit dehydrogenase